MSAALTLLAYFVTGALVVMLLIAVTNIRAFLRLAQPARPEEQLRVSILIPARNEARRIAPTLRSLLRQDYPDYEILILDDHSVDGTTAVVNEVAAGDRRVRVLAGAPLPTGWLGKPWACHQLSRSASGEMLLFTDADVIWKPAALSALMQQMTNSDADLLTVWPTQITVSWAERLIVPLMAMAVLAYLPLPLAHSTRVVQAAAANGQCMAFRRRAYEQCGGHAAVAGRIIEDIALAEAVKRVGLNLRMADGNGLVSCRMYQNCREVINGYTKNILAGHRNSFVLLAFSATIHFLLFVAPWLWLGAIAVANITNYSPPFVDPSLQTTLWPLALVCLGVAIRAATARATDQRVGDALLMPLSALIMTGIAVNAVWQQLRYGGQHWKGRLVREQMPASPSDGLQEPHHHA